MVGYPYSARTTSRLTRPHQPALRYDHHPGLHIDRVPAHHRACHLFSRQVVAARDAVDFTRDETRFL